MKLTPAQTKELKVWEYFIPKNCDWLEKTNNDIKIFFEWSERGKHKDFMNIFTYKPEGRTYAHALFWGKKWATTHARMYEEHLLSDHWWGYEELLKEMPREVVDFLKKEMFKGYDAEIMEHSYA